jgi:hypothetical protein
METRCDLYSVSLLWEIELFDGNPQGRPSGRPYNIRTMKETKAPSASSSEGEPQKLLATPRGNRYDKK